MIKNSNISTKSDGKKKQEEEEEDLDQILLLTLNNNRAKLLESIVQSAKLHKRFWNELKQMQPGKEGS